MVGDGEGELLHVRQHPRLRRCIHFARAIEHHHDGHFSLFIFTTVPGIVPL